MKKRTIYIIMIILVVLITTGCNLNSIGIGDSVEITIVLAMPDYHNHIFFSERILVATPATVSDATKRVVDSSTYSIEITVSGADITATDPYLFTFDNAERVESGIYLISCVIPSVPVGTDRTFSVITSDNSGTTLTTGSSTTDIYSVGSNIVRIPLIPANPIVLSIGATYTGSVEYGAMDHFSITGTTAGTLTLTLTSDQDVDFLVFNSDGTRYTSQFWETGAPTDESVSLSVVIGTLFYLSVFGNTAAVANDYIITQTQTDEEGNPIEPPPTTYLMGGAIQGNDLGLDTTTADVVTIAGQAGVSGSTNGTGTTATFWFPAGITTDGTTLYLADAVNDLIREIDIATVQVTTLFDTGTVVTAADYYTAGITTDGTYVYAITYDQFNSPYPADVIKIDPSTGTGNTLSCTGLNGASGITTDNVNLYVTDSNNHRIVQVNPTTGSVTHLAGDTGGTAGYVNGTATVARFDEPLGITTDGTYLYVTETNNHTIRQITIADGTVALLAGDPGNPGSSDGTGSAAQFDNPKEITCDGTNLYVGDSYNDCIRKIVIATGEVTTIAGLPGSSGSTDGTGSAARFYYPWGVTTDGTSLFVNDMDNYIIRQIQ